MHVTSAGNVSLRSDRSPLYQVERGSQEDVWKAQGGSPEHGVKVGSVQWKVRRGGGSPEGNEGAQLLYTTGTRY